MRDRHIATRWVILAIVPTWLVLGIAISCFYENVLHDWLMAGLITTGAIVFLYGAKAVARHLFGLTASFVAKQWRMLCWFGLALVLFRLAVPCPIRGNYVGSFTAHGCEERAFLRFADGQITYFHGNLQPERKGRYERVGWNTYAWKIGPNGDSEATITVGWLFVRIYGGRYWLHRDLSFASDRMVKTAAATMRDKPPRTHVDGTLLQTE